MKRKLKKLRKNWKEWGKNMKIGKCTINMTNADYNDIRRNILKWYHIDVPVNKLKEILKEDKDLYLRIASIIIILSMVWIRQKEKN